MRLTVGILRGLCRSAPSPPAMHVCVMFVPALCSTTPVPAVKQLLGRLITNPGRNSASLPFIHLAVHPSLPPSTLAAAHLHVLAVSHNCFLLPLVPASHLPAPLRLKVHIIRVHHPAALQKNGALRTGSAHCYYYYYYYRHYNFHHSMQSRLLSSPVFPRCQVRGASVPATQVRNGAKTSYRHDGCISHSGEFKLVTGTCVWMEGFCRLDPKMIHDLNKKKKAVSPIFRFLTSVKSDFPLTERSPAIGRATFGGFTARTDSRSLHGRVAALSTDSKAGSVSSIAFG